MILEFQNARCTLCGRPVEEDRALRFSASDRRSGWGCSCRRRKLAVVGDDAAFVSITDAGRLFLRENRHSSAASAELDE